MALKKAFTLVELVVVIGIMTTLLTLTYINLAEARNRTDFSTIQATLISDIRGQQLKAMTGDTEGSSAISAYGVYIQAQSYVLFRGSTYTAGSAGNLTINVSSPKTVTSNFASNTIVFNAGSGEINGYVNGQNQIVISDTQTSQSVTTQLSVFGAFDNTTSL